MNKAFLMRLDRRLDESNTAANNGFLLTWYRILRTTYRIIHYKIEKDSLVSGEFEKPEDKPKDFKTIPTRFEDIKGALKNARGRQNIQQKQFQALEIQEAEELLDDLDIDINNLIFKYELIKLTKKKNDPSNAIEEEKFG